MTRSRHIHTEVVDGSNESLHRPDEESDLILRKGIPLQKSFQKVDVQSDVHSLGYRLLRICSDNQVFLKRLEELRQNLLSRQYPAKIIHQAFEKVKKITREEALKRVEKKTTEREVFALTYHPALPSAAQLVRQHWQVMVDQCPSMRRCFE